MFRCSKTPSAARDSYQSIRESKERMNKTSRYAYSIILLLSFQNSKTSPSTLSTRRICTRTKTIQTSLIPQQLSMLSNTQEIPSSRLQIRQLIPQHMQQPRLDTSGIEPSPIQRPPRMTHQS